MKSATDPADGGGPTGRPPLSAQPPPPRGRPPAHSAMPFLLAMHAVLAAELHCVHGARMSCAATAHDVAIMTALVAAIDAEGD